MPYNFTVSPDFAPDRVSGWFYFNTWLQRQLGVDIHLELYDGFDQQRRDIRAGKVDLIYANPYDASMLVREMGFRALVRPVARRDEAVIAVPAESEAGCVEDLAPGLRLATTADPDVHTIGMIMLESADLDNSTVTPQQYESYVLVAKALLRGEADAGFFLKQSYEELSDLIRRRLRALVSSQIGMVHHALLVGPRLLERGEHIIELMTTMELDTKGAGVLDSMDIMGWERMSAEQTEFMIDLIDTLVD